MVLSCVERTDPGYDKRSFRCAICGLQDSITVKIGTAATIRLPKTPEIRRPTMWLEAAATKAARNSELETAVTSKRKGLTFLPSWLVPWRR
jgi:hypothetical protein